MAFKQCINFCMRWYLLTGSILLVLMLVLLFFLAQEVPPCDPTTETLWCGSELTRESIHERLVF